MIDNCHALDSLACGMDAFHCASGILSATLPIPQYRHCANLSQCSSPHALQQQLILPHNLINGTLPAAYSVLTDMKVRLCMKGPCTNMRITVGKHARSHGCWLASVCLLVLLLRPTSCSWNGTCLDQADHKPLRLAENDVMSVGWV